MFDKIFTAFVRLFYGRQLRQQAETMTEKNDLEAGTYAAARFTRGNVAIQQGRFSEKPLYK